MESGERPLATAPMAIMRWNAVMKVNDSPATLAEGWHMLAGVGIWLLIFIELYQRRSAWQQRAELGELEQQRQRLAEYTVQARYALATMYDHAASVSGAAP